MKKHSLGKKLAALLLSAALVVPLASTAVNAAGLFGTEVQTVQAIRPYITGMETVGTQLSGVYTYYDTAGRPESGTTFRWLRSSTKQGEYQPIPGADGATYTLTEKDAGKYIRFEVVPRCAGADGQAEQSFMIGPVLTADQYARVDNRYDNSNDFMANVNSIQDEIAARTANAVYFTVDSGQLHGSDVLMKDNVKFDFEDDTRPIVRGSDVLAPIGFFTEYLGVTVSEAASVSVGGGRYYNLKLVVSELGKEYWSGDEKQSELDNFQMEHLGQGLIVISDTKDIFDPVADRDLIDEACNQLYTLRATDEQMQWFRDAKYGMFLHWDPSSQLGVEISWDRKAFRPYDIGSSYQNAIDPEYDTLGETFNPTEYNPDEWMQLAKEAGMKYVVLTTKHHGSYSNFFSDFDNHTIEYSPYGKDIVEQYVAAAKNAGLKVGFYYSARDWYNPNYLTADHHRYLEYYFGQIQELMTKYGDIDIMWFDSIGTSSLNQWDPRTLLRRMKQINPDVIVNNRYTAVLAGYDKSPYDVNGDWYTPEHRLGGFDSSRPWESCMTVTEAPGGGWSYRPDGRVKTVEESVKYLINNVVNDGNLLYNIGPMPNGKLNEEHAEVFRQVGKWLEPYGEAVYSTRGGPYQNPQWGGSTYRTNEDGTQTIYLHVTPLLKNYSPPDNTLQIADPGNGQIYDRATLVKSGEAVSLQKNEGGMLLTLPEGESWDAYDTVIRLNADVQATLEKQCGEAEQYAAGLDGLVKESLLSVVTTAREILSSGASDRYSEQLVKLNAALARAQSAAALADLIASAQQKLSSVAVGENPWDCPEALYNKLQTGIGAAASLLEDGAATKEQFDAAASNLQTVAGSLDEIMNSLMIAFTPSDGQVTEGATFQMSAPYQQLSIRYTLDGSAPTADSALYDGSSLPIPRGVATVQAALFDGSRQVGAVCGQTYLNYKAAHNLSPSASSATASSVYNSQYTGDKACDGNSSTRWATPDGTITATLELRFDSPQTLNTAMIQEYVDPGQDTRISSFAIEYWKDGDWEQAYTGGAGGTSKVVAFDAVTSDRVRLNIKACMNVTIFEFSLFNITDSVSLSAEKTHLQQGEDTRLTVTGELLSGGELTPDMVKEVSYHTDQPDIVTVDASGLLHVGRFADAELSFQVWADVTLVNGGQLTTPRLSLTASRLGENLALHKGAAASSIYSQQYPAALAVDGSDRTRWATQPDQPEYWLEIDLGQAVPLNLVKFRVYSDRADPVNYEVYTSFKIQAMKDGAWTDVYDSAEGTHSTVYPVYNGSESYSNVWVDSSGVVKSTDYTVPFDTVTTDKIRLYSDSTKKDPSIIAFEAYNLVGATDVSALKAAIAEAAGYGGTESLYTPESWKTFAEALAEANAVLADDRASQAGIDTAAAALRSAISGLVPREPAHADKGILERVIAYAQKAKTGSEYAGAIPSVQQSFAAALADAESVSGDPFATQQQVDAAWIRLMNEIHKLGFQAGDKAQLEQLLFQAAGIDLNNYVDAGQSAFTEALAGAQACFAEPDALAGDVDAAVDALLDAMMNLRFKADKSILRQLISKAEAMDLSAYTPQSVLSFNGAKARADEVCEDENSAQQEVDTAAGDLRTAMDNLVPLSAPGKSGSGTASGTAGSPRTGDSAPAAAAAALLLCGALLTGRKRRQL